MNAEELLDLVTGWNACQPAREWLATLDPETDFMQVVEQTPVMGWINWLEEKIKSRMTKPNRDSYIAAVQSISDANLAAIGKAKKAYKRAIEPFNKTHAESVTTAQKIYDATTNVAKRKYYAATQKIAASMPEPAVESDAYWDKAAPEQTTYNRAVAEAGSKYFDTVNTANEVLFYAVLPHKTEYETGLAEAETEYRRELAPILLAALESITGVDHESARI